MKTVQPKLLINKGKRQNQAYYVQIISSFAPISEIDISAKNMP